MIRAERIGVNQDFILSRRSFPRIQNGLLLVGRPLQEEIAAVLLDRDADALNAHQLGQALLQCLATGPGIEQGARVLVLRIDPGARFRALLVFEPAVGVGDFDAVNDLPDVVRARRRRRRELLRLKPGRCDRQEQQRRKPAKRSPLTGVELILLRDSKRHFPAHSYLRGFRAGWVQAREGVLPAGILIQTLTIR